MSHGDRIKKQRTGFTQIPNALICDPTVSAKAKAIYCYLFSRPDDWTFYMTEIIDNFKESRDAIYSGMEELQESGWIFKDQVRVSGKFSHNVFEIYIEKLPPSKSDTGSGNTENGTTETDKTDDGNTAYGKPVNGETDTNNTDNTNTDLTKTDSKNTPQPPKGGAVDFVALSNSIDGAYPLNFEAYSEWVEYKRKDKRQKIGESTAKKQIKMLRKFAPHIQRQMIDRSITNGWQGLFELNGAAAATATGNNQLDQMVQENKISTHAAQTMAAGLEIFGGRK